MRSVAPLCWTTLIIDIAFTKCKVIDAKEVFALLVILALSHGVLDLGAISSSILYFHSVIEKYRESSTFGTHII
ncbi:hypothetical protein KCU89_g115, partial [Aureobasidium melanogenum]